MNSVAPLRLALADDHIVLRKGLCNLINSFDNMEVVLDADNGEDLISAIEQLPELPDVCIVDINMPRKNGYETTQAIKQRWPNVGIIALSMYDSELNIIRMFRHGANGYVLKDSHPSELRHAIEEVNRAGFYHSEFVSEKLMKALQQEGTGSITSNHTDKEIEFLAMCCTELTYREIAEQMNLSPRTVDGYRDNLFTKLNIKSRTGLVVYAIRSGIVLPAELR